MKAVILAGGKGTRLRPYTTTIPKPLMPVGDKAILEIVLAQMKKHGFTDITLAVGHLSQLIEAYFSDGNRHGVKISYAHEDEPLGTAGPLANIKGLDEDFLAMNGDILTTLDYTKLMKAHKASKAAATIAVNKRTVQVDYGVISTNARNEVEKYTEKPKLDYQVSMGVNILSPRALKLIPKGKSFDVPDLIRALLAKGEKVLAYPSGDYWLDIGRPEDYAKAQEEFREEMFL